MRHRNGDYESRAKARRLSDCDPPLDAAAGRKTRLPGVSKAEVRFTICGNSLCNAKAAEKFHGQGSRIPHLTRTPEISTI
jgi:hypothetical protein